MNNDDNTMDLLDLDDGTSMDALPDAAPFAAPRPRKPWLLLGIGLLVIVLAVYIIVRTIGGNDTSTMDVNLDAPAIVVDGGNDVAPMDVNPNPIRPEVVPAAPAAPVAPVVAPTPVAAPAPQPAVVPQPAPQPKPQPVVASSDAGGVPTRVVEDRKTVTFNPDKPAAAKPKPVAKKTATAPAKKSSPKKVASQNGSWYVQFGSYSTRALAEAAQRQIRNAHSALFQGKQFVILAAQMPNGQTLYRLRIAFATSADANGFCRNAKSDGLDCYVAK